MTIQELGTITEEESAAGDRRRWIALVVVCLAMFMNALDGSIVNVALPDIQKSLHFSQSGLTWVVDAYLITFGSFLLMAGRLGDLIGRKKVFLAGVTLFMLASIACGAADSQAMLVGGPLRAGHRRCAVVLGDRGHHRHRVPEAGRAGQGDERLRVRGRRRRLHRAARRRRPDPVPELALDLLREHPDRHRHAASSAASSSWRTSASASSRGWTGSGRSSSPCRSWSASTASSRRRATAGARPTRSGILARRGRAVRVVHRPGVEAGQPDHAAADSADPDAHRLERHPWAARHRHVLHLLHRRALPRARAGLHPRSRPAWPSCRRPSERPSCRRVRRRGWSTATARR